MRQTRVPEGRSRQSRLMSAWINLTGAAVYAELSRSRYFLVWLLLTAARRQREAARERF